MGQSSAFDLGQPNFAARNHGAHLSAQSAESEQQPHKFLVVQDARDVAFEGGRASVNKQTAEQTGDQIAVYQKQIQHHNVRELRPSTAPAGTQGH